MDFSISLAHPGHCSGQPCGLFDSVSTCLALWLHPGLDRRVLDIQQVSTAEVNNPYVRQDMLIRSLSTASHHIPSY
jgi:hypothetical protein